MNREVVQGEGEGGTKNSHGAEKGGAPLSLSVSTVHLPLLLPPANTSPVKCFIRFLAPSEVQL